MCTMVLDLLKDSYEKVHLMVVDESKYNLDHKYECIKDEAR